MTPLVVIFYKDQHQSNNQAPHAQHAPIALLLQSSPPRKIENASRGRACLLLACLIIDI
jgi:hypothetical protein